MRVYAYMCVCARTVYVCACACVDVYARMYVCVNVYVCVCVYASMYIWRYIYMYAYIFILNVSSPPLTDLLIDNISPSPFCFIYRLRQIIVLVDYA